MAAGDQDGVQLRTRDRERVEGPDPPERRVDEPAGLDEGDLPRGGVVREERAVDVDL
ncbi:MAG: hypothetical protein HY720_15470 [Planctomycetes bacterium]|nr:hypothetical protein [Planctomycetota bacterium]